MADNVMTYRLVVKEIALQNGVYATFMPKPIFGQNGSGMHVHQSLFSKDGNAFFDANDPEGFNLSQVAKHYIAGLLKYAPEFTAVTNPLVNSYKRLVPGYEAPVYIAWARRNRSALVRVPMYKPGKENATRLELRSPDPSANPYLAFAVHARRRPQGYRGEAAAHAGGHQQHLPHERRRARGRRHQHPAGYPRRGHRPLRELGAHEGSPRRAHPLVLRREQAQAEWDEYRMQVTEWELDKYLSII